MRLVFDSESDALKVQATRVWCLCAIDLDTNDHYEFRPSEIGGALDLLSSASVLVGHNLLGHDIPLFKKLYPEWQCNARIFDTFILSSLSNPDRVGGHSIENFGRIFNRPKPAHEDWSQFSEDMLHRCMEDTEINLMAYNMIMEELDGWDWDESIRLEHAIARVNAQQELNGVNFDAKQAWDTLERIHEELEVLEHKIVSEAPSRLVLPYKVPISKPFLKSGGYSQYTLQWFGGDADLVGGPFTRISFEPLNIHSSQQVKDYLLSLGWRPTEWNYKKDGKRIVKDARGNPIKTSPKLTEDSYQSLPEGLGQDIARYNVLDHRRSLIYNIKNDGTRSGWLNQLRDDGRITAEGIPLGTPTGRYRHKTVVNVPKADKDIVYGKEMRELFIPRDGYLLVGTDAKALENRIEGHYTAYYDGGEYAQTLLDGDPHTKNAMAFSEALQKEITRSIAKNIKYAITYGAQPAKVAETAGVKEKYGKILYEAFWDANPALAALRRDVEARVKKHGYLRGIDGRKLFIRSLHAALNTLFQSTGSLVVKTATIFLWDLWIPRYQLDAKLVIHQHDEWQAEVNPKNIDQYTELSLKSFVQSGQWFRLNIPIEGDVKVGRNWAETH